MMRGKPADWGGERKQRPARPPLGRVLDSAGVTVTAYGTSGSIGVGIRRSKTTVFDTRLWERRDTWSLRRAMQVLNLKHSSGLSEWIVTLEVSGDSATVFHHPAKA